MIREFRQADSEQVMQIWLNGNTDAHPFIGKTYWEANLGMVKEQLLQAEVYVYETDKKIQGFVGLQGDYIAGIFVKRECRSMGIGRQLLNHVKKSHSSLTLHVYQKNRGAMEFYKREDFSILSEGTDPDTKEADAAMVWNHEEGTGMNSSQ